MAVVLLKVGKELGDFCGDSVRAVIANVGEVGFSNSADDMLDE